eukprot:scaffold71042_cov32-Tisochrysis_lutea.AAC.1
MGVDRWHSPPLRPLLRMLLLLVSLTVCSAAGERLQCEELLDLATRITRSDDVELPTLVLVGHKNDGKSSLFEALLGLKLTHVGNDAATRRPLVVTSQYDPAATEPVLYLKRNGQEERVRLDDLRSYLQAENLRLEEAGTYEAEPVHVRLIWKRASTLVLIDTPGLIGDTQNEELAALKEYVEQIVAAQIMPPKRLILCLEDTSDWALVNTMGVVSRIDPDLKRTVLVATKLDAKMAQVKCGATALIILQGPVALVLASAGLAWARDEAPHAARRPKRSRAPRIFAAFLRPIASSHLLRAAAC